LNPSPSLYPSRFWTLDVFRGVAILAVVGFHAFTSFESNESDPSFAWVSWLKYGGILGVSSFFCLSGLSVHLAQLRKQATQSELTVNWQTFFWRRFSHVYPPYLGAIGLAIAIHIAWSIICHRNPVAHLPSIPDLVSHLLLLHSLNPETFFGIVPALWFIGVLAQLYLLYPIFWRLKNKWGCDRALLTVLMVTLTCRYLSTQIPLSSIAHPNQEIALWNTAFHRWFEWCCGAWVGDRIHKGFELKTPPWLFLFFIVGWLVIGSEVKVLYEPLLGLFLGGMIWTLLSFKIPSIPRIWLPFQKLGQISYSVYLLHQIFLAYLQSALVPNDWNIATNVGVLFTLVLLVTLPISVLYHHGFEHLSLKSLVRST
jgi:peptidoglycan/LPS O-acetylase OafA/YrhL